MWTNCSSRNSPAFCHLLPRGGTICHSGSRPRFRLPATLLASFFFLTPPFSVLSDQIFLRANQLGYLPASPKIALAFSKSEIPHYFALLSVENQQIVHEARPRVITNVSWGQFERHAELDFSTFKTPGRYFLKMGDSMSLPFSINDSPLDPVPDQLLEFMRQQRCGYNPWLDAVCHPFDGRTAYGPMTNGSYLDARGGWHDAADLLKYLLTSANATAQMLLAWQLSQNPVGPSAHAGSPGRSHRWR